VRGQKEDETRGGLYLNAERGYLKTRKGQRGIRKNVGCSNQVTSLPNAPTKKVGPPSKNHTHEEGKLAANPVVIQTSSV